MNSFFYRNINQYSLRSKKDIIQREYLVVLKNRTLKIFPGMSMEKILWNEAFFCQNAKWWEVIKRNVKAIFFYVPNLKINVNGLNLLCIYTKNYRPDHDLYWERIKEDAGVHDDITILHGKMKIDVGLILRKIKWYCNVFKELSGVGSIKDRLFLSSQLVIRKCVFEEIKYMNLNPKVVMCFFDSSPDENVLMQYFKQKNAITITNQHGQPIFRSWDYDRVNQSQILNFKCDYFFAKGNMQVKQFLKAGFDEKRIIPIGVIDRQVKIKGYRETNCFCIYLDTPGFDFSVWSNTMMIKIANEISDKSGMRYYVKPHPADNCLNYSGLIGRNCLEIFDSKMTLIESFKHIDFAIIHASSTYVDAYLHGVRCFKMKTPIPFPISFYKDDFENTEEICRKISEWKSMAKSERYDYISKIKKMYDCGWEKGRVRNVITTLMKSGII